MLVKQAIVVVLFHFFIIFIYTSSSNGIYPYYVHQIAIVAEF